MAFVGAWYAASQAVLAKRVLLWGGSMVGNDSRAKADPTKVLLVCAVGLSLGRVIALLTTSQLV
jgi:hypothetical protein